MSADVRRLRVALTPHEFLEANPRDVSVLVVDVLRATTTIPHALRAGAERVIPAETVEGAKKLRERLGDHALLCGEREGKRIEGFDLGNSPLEYVPRVVRGRVLIFSSTNGTKAMVRAIEARRMALASFVNSDRAAAWAAAEDKAVVVVCAGKLGRASLEDVACAGRLVELILARCPEFVPDDAARIARTVWREENGDVGRILRESSHGRYLLELGFAGDLEAAAAEGSVDVLPVLRDGQFGAYDETAPSHASR